MNDFLSLSHLIIGNGGAAILLMMEGRGRATYFTYAAPFIWPLDMRDDPSQLAFGNKTTDEEEEEKKSPTVDWTDSAGELHPVCVCALSLLLLWERNNTTRW